MCFPVNRIPALIALECVGTTFRGGSLGSIYGATLSDNSAPVIIRDLTAKFGPPTVREADTTLIDKIPVPCTHAVWRRPGFTVDYRSVESDIDHGYLMIETDAARVAREAKDRARGTERTPL